MKEGSKDLCFHCDDKYGPSHRCKKLFYILIISTDDKLNQQKSKDDWPKIEESCNEQGTLLTAHV